MLLDILVLDVNTKIAVSPILVKMVARVAKMKVILALDLYARVLKSLLDILARSAWLAVEVLVCTAVLVSPTEPLTFVTVTQVFLAPAAKT